MTNTNIGYEKKYLKYKKKYLNLKNQLAGSNLPPPSKLTRSTNEHEWGGHTNPEDDLPPPPNNPPRLQRQNANPTNEDDLPPPPNNAPRLKRQKANPSYENSYTVILSGIGGGRILRNMERRDLENNDILITNKRESFLIDFFRNLTLFNGKIYSVKINSKEKTIYLTNKEN